MSKDIKKYINANREAWNEVTPIHQRARDINLKDKFKDEKYSTLDLLITRKLHELPIKNKKIAQLCCNNGRETLSIINLGAASAVGFDISDAAIAEAKELQEISGQNCEFVQSDIYEINNKYNNQFDLVFFTIGALCWLPELEQVFATAYRLLKPTGKLFLYEQHPFTDMLATPDEDVYDKHHPLKLVESYFRSIPWENFDGLDYLGDSKYKSKPNYCFHHKLSDILTAILKAGFILKEFEEYSHDISNLFRHLEKKSIIPLCYALLAQK